MKKIVILVLLLLFTGCSKGTNDMSNTTVSDSIETETSLPVTTIATSATSKTESNVLISENTEAETNIITEEKDIKDQNKALMKYQMLTDSFYDSETKTSVYPYNYGGAFYSNGYLNINITDDNKQKYITVIGNDSIKFNKVKFFYIQLKNLNSFIGEIIKDTRYGIASCGIDVEGNCVEITVIDEHYIKVVEDDIKMQFPQIDCYRFVIGDYASPC